MNVLNKLRQISLMASVLFMSNQCSGMMKTAQSVADLSDGTVIVLQGSNGKYITYGNSEPLTNQAYSIASNQPYIPCWTWFSLSGTNPAYPICQFTVEKNSDGSFTLTSRATDEPLQAIPAPATATNPAFVLASGVANLPANAENWNITIFGGQATLRNENTGFLLNPSGTLLRATGFDATSFTIHIISSPAVAQVTSVAGATATGIKTSKVKGTKGKTATSTTGASVTSGKVNRSKKSKASTSTSATTSTTTGRKTAGKKGALAKQMTGTLGTAQSTGN